MDPFFLFRWPLLWIRFWTQKVGMKGVLAMLAGGTVLAIFLNYKT